MKNIFMPIGVVLFVLGILAILGADKLGINSLSQAALGLFGLAAACVGLDALITRRIAFRQRNMSETYTGVAAVAYGMLFLFLAAFLLGLALLVQAESGRDFFLAVARRPGGFLVTLGGMLSLGAVIAFSGSVEGKQGTRFDQILNLIFSRALPAVILISLGLAAFGLGIFETLAPAAFDNLGGGFIETFFTGPQ
jgi:hypothetical protein